MSILRKTVLLTGGGGLLGQALASSAPDGWDIYSVGRNLPQLPSVTNIELDLTDPDFCERLPAKVDAIVHLAQSRRFREFPAGSLDVFAVNSIATLKLLDYAQRVGCKQFVYASTGGVYKPVEGVLTESSPILDCDSSSIYPASKIAAEMMLGAYKSVMNVAILRFFFIYGEGQESTMLMPRLVSSVKNGDPINLAGENGFSFCPLYVSDAVHLVSSVVESEYSGVLNVAGPNVMSLREVCDVIGTAIGREPVYKVLDTAPVNFVVDSSRLEEKFGRMHHSFESVVGRVVSE
ncbi:MULTISPECIES: NAD-dependent epimerase/dehydratase family protein [unclassified Pseudomonas]|jgi:nucleoside-diphosphate-sugar epimerase|uniref:NAD-dependent epimerase/dehydratase family protein n=1 Tax=unclassified Pseudomonas TaxID=196821 RepID=UPI001CBDCDDF|nr:MULTISPECIES: NAD(P)-dependent oxidoreductase [unclassified Pseudomonas]